MGTEDYIPKGTKLKTNTKKQRLKIQSRGQTLRNTILKLLKQNQSQNYEIYVCEVALKMGSFCKIIGYKNEKGVIRNLN